MAFEKRQKKLVAMSIAIFILLIGTCLGRIELSPFHKPKISLLKSDRIWYPMSDFFSIYSAADAEFKAKDEAKVIDLSTVISEYVFT